MNKIRAYVKLEQFGQTRIVEAELIVNHYDPRHHTMEIDEIFYGERDEDFYALQNERYKNLNVAVVDKQKWDAGIVLSDRRPRHEPWSGLTSDYS